MGAAGSVTASGPVKIPCQAMTPFSRRARYSRGPALSDIPTMTEQGYKFDANGWYGIFAPAGTPAAVVRRLNEEINRILATEPMRQQFASQNMLTPPIKTVEQFAATVKTDVELWQALGRAANLRID